MDSYQEKAEASMAKLEKIEETMEHQMKHLMIAKWNTHQEMTEIDPDTEMMQSAVEHQEFPKGKTVMPEDQGSGIGSESWPQSSEDIVDREKESTLLTE
jgi:hypothetical protein